MIIKIQICILLDAIEIFKTKILAWIPMKPMKDECKGQSFPLATSYGNRIYLSYLGDTAILIMHYFKNSKISTSVNNLDICK